MRTRRGSHLCRTYTSYMNPLQMHSIITPKSPSGNIAAALTSQVNTRNPARAETATKHANPQTSKQPFLVTKFPQNKVVPIVIRDITKLQQIRRSYQHLYGDIDSKQPLTVVSESNPPRQCLSL